MAVIELRYGKNEQLKRIAQEIIVDQMQEIGRCGSRSANACRHLTGADPILPPRRRNHHRICDGYVTGMRSRSEP